MIGIAFSDRQKELIEREKALGYPGNQHFHPCSFVAYPGETEERVRHIDKHIPELKGGGSLLDIGSNKGFIAFTYGRNWGRVVGYEPAAEYHQFAQDVLDTGPPEFRRHVRFIHGDFRQIPLRKERQIKRQQEIHGTRENGMFDVVYVGSVHHHFYRDALRHGVRLYLWAEKLKGLCAETLIIDGPEDGEDPSCQVFAREEGWGNREMGTFSAERVARALWPQFVRVRSVPNERRRVTQVFKRIAPNVPTYECSLALFVKDGEQIAANAARDSDTGVWRLGSMRLKLDPNPLPSSMLVVLNALSDAHVMYRNYYMPRVRYVVRNCDGEEVGDIVDWAEGPRVSSPAELWEPWIDLNIQLEGVGLWEPHFKPSDYVNTYPGAIDVDVDMIQSPWLVTDDYLARWLEARIENLPERKAEWEYIVAHLTEPDVFLKVRDGTWR